MFLNLRVYWLEETEFSRLIMIEVVKDEGSIQKNYGHIIYSGHFSYFQLRKQSLESYFRILRKLLRQFFPPSFIAKKCGLVKDFISFATSILYISSCYFLYFRNKMNDQILIQVIFKKKKKTVIFYLLLLLEFQDFHHDLY